MMNRDAMRLVESDWDCDEQEEGEISDERDGQGMLISKTVPQIRRSSQDECLRQHPSQARPFNLPSTKISLTSSSASLQQVEPESLQIDLLQGPSASEFQS